MTSVKTRPYLSWKAAAFETLPVDLQKTVQEVMETAARDAVEMMAF